jgi:hypothetical protein
MTETAREILNKMLDLLQHELSCEKERADKRSRLEQTVSILTNGKVPIEGFKEDSPELQEALQDPIVSESVKHALFAIEQIVPMKTDEISYFNNLITTMTDNPFVAITPKVSPAPTTPTAPTTTATPTATQSNVTGVGKLTQIQYIDWIPDVPKYRYFASDDGKIHEIIKNRDCIRRARVNFQQNLVVDLRKKNGEMKAFQLDKLIWQAFNPQYRLISFELGHKDNDILNCDLSNLYLK